jgi:peptidoglycan/xylan/chitin deacetylase (PgdA/CDA1 family)
MLLLKWLGYQGLCMGALEPYVRGEKHGKVVGITFDDGYVNNLDFALPVLRNCGFSATCYVVSGQIGGSNLWDSGKGVPAKPLMDAAQLASWVAGGQEIGAHTRSHVDLTGLDLLEAREEIEGVRKDLERLLGQEVRQFCYPYGLYRPEHVAMVRAAGYSCATTTQRSRSQDTDDIYTLPRVPVHQATTLAAFWLKVATAYEDKRRQ